MGYSAIYILRNYRCIVIYVCRLNKKENGKLLDECYPHSDKNNMDANIVICLYKLSSNGKIIMNLKNDE